MKIFYSRTNWTIFIAFLVGGIVGIEGYLSPAWLILVEAILGIIAIYFRCNPRVDFPKPK